MWAGPMTLRVAVIGAGIVGTASALALLRLGYRVTIVEPDEPGGPQAASHGNGAWISPASVVPIAMPGLWRKVPGYLLDRTGPFTIRPSALPGALPWLLRFLRAGSTTARVEATARHLRTLLETAPDLHEALASEAGVPDLIRRAGLLYCYPDRAAFDREAAGWSLRRQNGIAWTELDAAALRAREPDLAPTYGFGAFVAAGAHCHDTAAYGAALARRAVESGADIVRGRATGFGLRDGRLTCVRSEGGDVACDRAVVTAGIGSLPLSRALGDRVSLIAERGYHVVVPDAPIGPRTPLMPSDGKMANTPTQAGLRASGQVELAPPGTPPDWRRTDILLGHLRRAYPGLPATGDETFPRWMGNRPSTPDGLPVIGRSRASPDVVYGFGHGHVGFASGPITGLAVADLIAGRPDRLPLAPFRASRF